jgi:hypothetical protein
LQPGDSLEDWDGWVAWPDMVRWELQKRRKTDFFEKVYAYPNCIMVSLIWEMMLHTMNHWYRRAISLWLLWAAEFRVQACSSGPYGKISKS